MPPSPVSPLGVGGRVLNREHLLDSLMFISLLMILTWLMLQLLDILTGITWFIYTRIWREYLLIIGLAINILIMVARRRR